ncbi:Ig-like domain-containing protein [Enterobacter asburiae]|uniref:Ig-like domain-containing protein n=1 Tax=Enterobacter asburiae TaxID=61645 RepID=UPI0020038F0B|nr:Ig-like domain-containing protein [Enterobacter asburiae]MCK7229467.1 Ig-like domain-containing protein [Enterobacter asburiae]
MTDSVTAGSSLIFYTGKNYAGSAQQVTHGVTAELAGGSAAWDYLSVAMTAMDAFVFSAVNTADASLNYLGHVEAVISVSQADLTLLYPSSDQFPLNYLGLDPAQAAVVWLDVNATQAVPNAVASTALPGGGTTTLTTLSLPGRPGALGFVAKTEGSSVVASCRYGDYNTANGTVAWRGTGTLILEYTGGVVTLINGGGFPAGWTFSQPQLQGDGSWAVTLDGGVPASDTISSVTANPASIVDDGVSRSVITATVLNGSGQPAAGVTVSWSTTLGTVTPGSSVTDANGLATATLTDCGAPGTATVTASITGSSKSVDVTVSAGSSGHIKVMGARRSNSYYYHQANACVLVALDSVSLQPVNCYWQYDGDAEIFTATRLTDTAPEKLLKVTPVNGGPSRVLNPSNIVGNGYDGVTATAFAARMDGGTVTSWGYAGSGGVPPVTSYNRNVVKMSSSYDVMIALNSNGQVFSWGSAGSAMPAEITALTDAVEIANKETTRAVIRANGQVMEWASGVLTTLPAEIASLNDCVKITATLNSFAVLRSNGKVAAWGAGNEGVVPPDVAALGDITQIVGNTYCFAVLRANGQVAAWGDPATGGTIPDSVARINDFVHIYAGDYRFIGLRANGQIVQWGDSILPANIASLNDIVTVTGNWYAGAALRSTGQVVAWGDERYGGIVPADIAVLTDIIALSETDEAFAALRANGEVVAWGISEYGGSIPPSIASMLHGIVAIYGSYMDFCALRDDNTVVVWGAGSAGDINAVPHNLQGAITYSYELQ